MVPAQDSTNILIGGDTALNQRTAYNKSVVTTPWGRSNICNKWGGFNITLLGRTPTGVFFSARMVDPNHHSRKKIFVNFLSFDFGPGDSNSLSSFMNCYQ